MAEEETTEGERDSEGSDRNEKDAMGREKRREVIGGQYGATVRKRLLVYGAVVGVIVLGLFFFLTVVTNYDNRDFELKDTAPWTQANDESPPPRDVDFKANGPRPSVCPKPCQGDVTIPAEDILNR